MEFHFRNQNSSANIFREFLIKKMEEISSSEKTVTIYQVIRHNTWVSSLLSACNDLQKVGGSCGDWMELAQDRDRWRALVGTVRNLRVPKMLGIS